MPNTEPQTLDGIEQEEEGKHQLEKKKTAKNKK